MRTLEMIRASWREGAPIAAVVLGGAENDALIAALAARGLNPLPMSSPRELAGTPLDIVVDATGSAAAAGIAGYDGPVLQLSPGPDAAWRIEMSIALPEVEALEGQDPLAGTGACVRIAGIAFAADLARNWVRLRRTPPAERRVVLMVLDGADFDGMAPQIDAVTRALAAAGQRAIEGHSLLAKLVAGPSHAAPWRPGDETFARSDYAAFFAGLPRAVQDAVQAQWGPAERDPFFREAELDCGHFALPAARLGTVGVALLAAPRASLPPRHGDLALYGWIADGVRAHALVRIGASA